MLWQDRGSTDSARTLRRYSQRFGKKDTLEEEEEMMAYIYAADLWCDRCGEEIRKRISREGNAPADPDDERSYDSDEFPKCVGDDEESDTPTNCAAGEECYEAESLPSGQRIGKQFGELTADGVVYLQEAIAEGGEVAEFWADYYDAYLD